MNSVGVLQHTSLSLGINESGEPLKVFLYSSFVAQTTKSFKDVFCIVLAWISSGTWLWTCMHKEHSTALGALAVTLDTLVVIAAAGSMVRHSAPGDEARLKYLHV